MDDLYTEARTLSARVAKMDEMPQEDPVKSLCHAVQIVQEKLLTDIGNCFASTVLEAASKGKTSALLLSFEGNEKYQNSDFSYLFLLKGPRERSQLIELTLKGGFRPLYDTLQEEFYPFRCEYIWMPGLNRNELRVLWDHHQNGP
jgi:hypothetical protein